MIYKLKVLFRFLKILLVRYKKRKLSEAIIEKAQKQTSSMALLVEDSNLILDEENKEIEVSDFELLEVQLVENTTTKDLQEALAGIERKTVINKRSFDIVAFKENIRVLNSKLFNVKLKIKNVKSPVEIKTKTDDILQEATSIANEIISNSLSLKAKSLQSFDVENNRFNSFFSSLGLAQIHEKRQTRRREQIQHFISKADQYIKIKNFLQARKSLQEAELIIRSSKIADYSNKLSKVKSRLVREEEQEKHRLLAEQKKKQEEEQKRLEAEIAKAEYERRLADEAEEKLRIAAAAEAEKAKQKEQERIKADLAKALAAKAAAEAEKLRREQANLREKARKEAEEQAKLIDVAERLVEKQKAEDEERERLNQLLTYKYNWQSFEVILKENKITTLYHFTDRANIASIKRNGGLYSWQYCERNNIQIPCTGGDSLSRSLDSRYQLQDFVRVSFCRKHPMKFVAEDQGRINEAVILHINTEVCFFENSMFSDMNATRNGFQCGSEVIDLKRVKFYIVKQENQFGLSAAEKPYYQAEVLVKTWIPIKYMTNIDQF
jgi:hypothetical protein